MVNYLNNTDLTFIKGEIKDLLIEKTDKQTKEYRNTGFIKDSGKYDLVLLAISQEIIEKYQQVFTEDQDGVINPITEKEFTGLVEQVYKKYPELIYPI